MKTIVNTLCLWAAYSLLAAGAAQALPDPDAYEPVVTPARQASKIEFGKRQIKDLEASLSECCAGSIHHGTPDVTFRFTNTAAHERSFTVKAAMARCASVGRSFSIQPGATAEFTLFLPFAVERGNSYNEKLSIFETTPGADPSLNMGYVNFPIGRFMSIYANDPFFLLSGGIAPKKLWQALSKAMEGSGYEQRYKEGGTPRRSRRSLARPMPKKKKPVPYRFEAFQFRLPADKWPGDWRLYSTYDGIFITEREYSALGADARSALETYRAFGGAVIVTKGRDGFADAQEAVAALKPIDDSCEALVGDLQIDYYFHSDNRNLLGDLKRIPIESKSTVPVKTLLAVLALFACVVVPVAVLRSVRRNTRIRLLALLPGAAAVFAAAVAVSAYAFFGVTPTTRLQSITVLDQTTKKAVTRGQFGVFSPVSMDGCIAFPSDAAFALRHASGNGDESATVESAGEQRLMEGWVKPLVSSFFDFARACERPERLDFRVSPDGGVSVVNLLGAKVKWGHANVGGKLWTFKDVEPGATAKAEELGKPFVPPKAARRPFGDELTSWGRDWKTSVERAKQSVQETPPGEYAVEVEGSPFFPDPVQGKKSRMSAAGLVFGKFKEVAE